MADSKITGLTELTVTVATDLAGTDLLAVVDDPVARFIAEDVSTTGHTVPCTVKHTQTQAAVRHTARNRDLAVVGIT